MRHAGKACFAARRAARSFLSLLLPLLALLAPLAAPAATAIHLGSAAWQVLPGGTFGPPPALPALDASRWQATALPHVLPRAVVPRDDAEAIDTAWFRIPLPSDVQALAPEDLRLYVPRWQTIGQVAVYADDRLVFRSRAGPVWNGFNHPLWIAPSPPGTPAHPQVLLVRIDHQRGAGAALSTVWLGDEAGLGQRRQWREFVQAGLPYIASSAFFALGLFALLAWVARREPLYLLFFLFSAFWMLRALHYHLGMEPLPLPEEWFGWLTVHSLSGLAVTANMFAVRLYGPGLRRLEAALIGLAAAAAVASLPPLQVWPIARFAPLVYLCMIAVFLVSLAACLRSAWRARSVQGLVVLGTHAAAVPLAVHDWLLQNYRIDIENVYLQPFTMIGLSSVFLLVVLRRHVAAIARSERAQEELERQLREREAQLLQSHERLRAVEHQQILDQERQRLMQDMHDGLGSTLMGALKAVENGHPQDLGEVLRQCIDDLKLAIDSLEPVQADLLLLLGTLRYRLGTRLEQSGARLHWEVQDVPPLPWLDPRSALHILRILQEVLGNIIKHSRAREVRLTTRRDAAGVLVMVEDDGVGFDPHAASRGRGLANVRRRAAAIGASAAWQSGAGRTRFVLVLPLQASPGTTPEPPLLREADA